MSNPNIILYHANWSFCSQMVRVALLEKGFSFDKRHIRLCDQYPEGENIDKDYLSINPLGTVPAIQIDGNTICGSEEIIYQLDKIDSNSAYSLYPDNVSEDEIRKGLEGNICRCTGYHNIVQSVKAGAAKMGG